MTRKDYIRIARAVKGAINSVGTNWDAASNMRRGIRDTTLAIAYELRQDNVNFKQAVFMTACGLDDVLSDGTLRPDSHDVKMCALIDDPTVRVEAIKRQRTRDRAEA